MSVQAKALDDRMGYHELFPGSLQLDDEAFARADEVIE